MKAIEFKDQNVIIAENQEEYENLPALKINDESGSMITCMGLSFWERLRVLWFGKIWVSELTFGKPITPRYMSTRRKDCYLRENEQLKNLMKIKIDNSNMCQCSDPEDAGSDIPDVFHKCKKCGKYID